MIEKRRYSLSIETNKYNNNKIFNVDENQKNNISNLEDD